ncbi:MAG: stage III sporulation protein AE, partial [Lachnospiraceae bacterium]|nr:stage III sporulation protein AE [Lachnospiraceae bacterium]
AVSWLLNTLLACIWGLNVIQGLISPAIDTVKRSVVTRGVEAIPGVGDLVGGAAEVALGTAVLVKNGIGMTGAVICIAICIVPLAQAAGIVLLYKIAAAVIQPVSDKRIVGCIETVGEGCRLLLNVIFTMSLLFLLTIVVVTAVTGNV